MMSDIYSNMGIILSSHKNYEKAVEYIKQALDIDLKIHGSASREVASDWNNLGGLWVSIGKYKKAIGYYERALDSAIKRYEVAHHQVATVQYNLGNAWGLLGQSHHYDKIVYYPKAIDYYELSLATYKVNYGDDHYKISKVRKALATVRWNIFVQVITFISFLYFVWFIGTLVWNAY